MNRPRSTFVLLQDDSGLPRSSGTEQHDAGEAIPAARSDTVPHEPVLPELV